MLIDKYSLSEFQVNRVMEGYHVEQFKRRKQGEMEKIENA